MQHLTYATTISASAEQVRHCMLDKPTYEQWTQVFDPSSTYEGSREQGTSIKFLSSTGEGMLSEIAESKLHKFVSIKHLGMMMINKETGQLETTLYPASEQGYEKYRFEENDGVTTLTVELTGLPEEYAPMMNEMRPKALDTLKELCER